MIKLFLSLCDYEKLKMAFICFAVCTFIQYIQRKLFENPDQLHVTFHNGPGLVHLADLEKSS